MKPSPFHLIVGKLSDDSLKDIYLNLVKINPLHLLLENDLCKAIVDEWHLRVDPKH
jgi:hypothetical protein